MGSIVDGRKNGGRIIGVTPESYLRLSGANNKGAFMSKFNCIDFEEFESVVGIDEIKLPLNRLKYFTMSEYWILTCHIQMKLWLIAIND
ncbi:hypothetical protein J1N10_18410 [Carboxylicivirga sp. A043]|uniref:hypothetical protein n=1 Tax=Carboxylicivirga litoralis TaxID=2816963 RepID=UPI0021CB36A8|nr:hypothetical protein [Carboxylicivirga sp. A043]MCU4157953.1 hypothetical protein [Carboxylicivirga sp. A043]